MVHHRSSSCSQNESFLAHSIQRSSIAKEDEDEEHESLLNQSSSPSTLRILAAEAFGTLLTMTLGLAANAQITLMPQKEFIIVWLSWGIAVLLGIAVSAPISGAHLNPAVTLALYVFGIPGNLGKRMRMQGKIAVMYVIVQFSAAFIAAGIVYLEYLQDFDIVDGGNRQIYGPMGTAGIFGTLPKSGVGVWSLLMDHILGTSALMIVVSAVSDAKRINKVMPEKFGPVLVALTVILVGFSLGINSGYPMNPARDLAPRMMSAIVGYGKGVFEIDPFGYWWIPVVGPCIGALVGAGAYRLFIDNEDLF